MLNFHPIALCIFKWCSSSLSLFNRLPPLFSVHIFLFAMWYDSVPLGQWWYVPNDAISMIMLNFAHHFNWTSDNSIVKYFMALIHRHYQKQSNVTTHTHTHAQRHTVSNADGIFHIFYYQNPFERKATQRKNGRKREEQRWYSDTNMNILSWPNRTLMNKI